MHIYIQLIIMIISSIITDRVIRRNKSRLAQIFITNVVDSNLLAPNLARSNLSFLNSTRQPQPQPVEMREINIGLVGRVLAAAAEVELDPHECLERDSSSSLWSSWDEGMNPAVTTTSSSNSSTISQQNKAFNQEEDDDGGCCIDVEFEEEEEDAIFKPSIKITKMDDDSIYISTIVMKEVSLTSTLFSVLEEEKLDIVFEDHYRTETKAAHRIQVRVQPGYNVDALETKLRSWAGCTT